MSGPVLEPNAVTGTAEGRTFQIKNCLGRGGFGEVYRATMMSAGGLRTEVAVKVLHAEVDPGSQAIQRLRDEGQMLGAVRHPSVLKVHDLVALDGRVALVTEYVEGQDLDKCIVAPLGAPARVDPLPARAVLEVIAKVADGLYAAYHSPSPTGDGPLQLVHRDIKPANIRLGRHGEVKLLDFGIARAANSDREARTETNAMLGSYLYMAPERFLDNVESGPAVDVYALGLTLYEGLTGRRMFGDLSLKEVYLLVLEGPRYDAHVKAALEKIPHEVPHQVVALIHRTLSLDPANRPDHETMSRTCHDLAERLPGRSLERWARGRDWPPPRVVRGVLDGSTLQEQSGVSSRPLPPVITSESQGDLLRTASTTLERPGVVVGVGVGLFGVTATLAVLIGLAVIGVVSLVMALRA
ncbi:MAG: serine/threonine-protein kinase, partial [Myxococcota bacterium]